MKVGVLGSTGQLGSDVARVFREAGHAVTPISHPEVEVADAASILTALEAIRPHVVVNCAAFVRVDEAESRPEEAFKVNAVGALNVARSCSALGAMCVYISTDFVFDGGKGAPYTEADRPHPINVYGTSKLAGEYLVQQACTRSLIARVASLFGKAGARGKGGNFVETILRRARSGEPLRVVDEIFMSPSYTIDVALALEKLVSAAATGIFHLTNAGKCSWYEFAREILRLASQDRRLEPIPSSEYPTKAKRPRDSTLISLRFPGIVPGGLRPWEEALRVYMAEKGHLQL